MIYRDIVYIVHTSHTFCRSRPFCIFSCILRIFVAQCAVSPLAAAARAW